MAIVSQESALTNKVLFKAIRGFVTGSCSDDVGHDHIGIISRLGAG